MATNVADCIKMFQEITRLPTPKVFGVGHGMRFKTHSLVVGNALTLTNI